MLVISFKLCDELVTKSDETINAIACGEVKKWADALNLEHDL